MQPPEAAAHQTSSLGLFSPDPAHREPVRRVHWLTLFLLLVAGAVVRVLFLALKPFWFDECFSAEVARMNWSNFLHLLWWREANMSLYYLLLRVWLRFEPHLELHFGTHDGQIEFFIRSLSVLMAVATIPAIYWLARQLYDRRVALIAAALLTFNAYSVRYSQEARSYALFLLLATLSSGFLIALLRAPTRRNRIGYALVSVLAVYAHFYALLLLVTHWLALRRLRSARGIDQPTQSGPPLAAQIRRVWITIGLAVLPLLIFVAKTGAGPIRWIQRPGLRDVLEFYSELAGGSNWGLLLLYVVACIAAVAPDRTRLSGDGETEDQKGTTNWETWRNWFLLLWLFFPAVITVLLSFARPVFLSRYMIFCLPPLLILTAAGLARLRQSWLLSAVLAGILLLASQGIFFVYTHDFDNERDASVSAANFILDHAQPGDAVVFHIAGTRIPYEFVRSLRTGENTASPDFADRHFADQHFTDQLGPQILFPYHGAGLDYRDFTGKPTADFLRTIAPSHPRVWIMLMNNGPADNPDPTTVMLTQILPESFPKILRWQFPRVEVRLYSK
jgi:mannosyltransferase